MNRILLRDMTCSAEWWWILPSESELFAADPLKRSPELTCVTYLQNWGSHGKTGAL